MRSGIVSIIGRPNVGKSTLLNTILERKLSIISDKAETTRNIIEGVYETDDVQIIFVDTPGIGKPINKLGSTLNASAYNTAANVDLILFMVDAKSGIGKGDLFVLNKIKDKDIPIILVLNKIDGLSREVIMKELSKTESLGDFKEIIPISAIKRNNIDDLIKTITKYLPNDYKLYNDGQITNITTKFYIQEIVREKVLNLTTGEVPHTVTCFVQTLEELDDIVNIQCDIIVDRENLKKIIIGKNGRMLGMIGSQARHDLEEYFGKKVYLENYVKCIDNWRDKEKYLIELGLKSE